MTSGALPRNFCWTKFGTEAGQTAEQIVRRKEEERRLNNGVFLWGIGNSLADSMRELVRRTATPDILFSPIKSTPRTCDSGPQQLVAWRDAVSMFGEEFHLPPSSLVTSRQDPDRLKTSHYALVCHSDSPLQLVTDGPFLDFAYLRNLSTGNRLGASQVTAIVEQGDSVVGVHRRYPVALRARLIAPFFVRLHNPVPVRAVRGQVGWGEAVMALWASKQ